MTSWPTCLAGRPSGVVFDCDGLLVDTEPSWALAGEQMFDRRGLSHNAADHAALLGMSTYDSVVLLAQRFGEVGREDALFDELLAEVVGLLELGVVPMPGAAELVARLRELEVPIAVASNSPRVVVELALRKSGLSEAFGTVVTADDVTRPKPAPDPYLVACDRLGVTASAAVGCEDSRTGLAAVQAAGLASIGVPSQPGDFPADWVVPSLADPVLAAWVSSWA